MERNLLTIKIVFIYVGQPVFAMQTKRTQFGVDGQMTSLIFHLYGYPPAQEVYVFAADDKTERIQINEIKIKNATVLDSFHGVVIHAIGYTINFEFGRLNEMDFRNYTIIAYNSHGNSKFDFEIIPASVGTFYFVFWGRGLGFLLCLLKKIICISLAPLTQSSLYAGQLLL